MPYTTPDLPYAYTALEPYLDETTMHVHHDKHHVAYTTKLNSAVEKHPDLFKKTPEYLIAHLSEVPEDIRVAVRNNGGGHVNHVIQWEVLAPKSGQGPTGPLADAINNAFGSFQKFREIFSNEAALHFGSGWVWLVVTKDKKLAIARTANQDSPTNEDAAVKGYPILNIDVWEHAYYLKYQNRRPEYIEAFWNIVNWSAVAKRYADAVK